MIRFALLCTLLLACGTKADDERQAYVLKSKAIEAKVSLNSLQRAAEMRVEETTALFAGTAGPSPSGNCCAGPEQKCPVVDADFAHPVWDSLNFNPFSDTRFNYSYQGDEQSFVATARGDLDCDGTFIEYVLTGKIENGALVTKLTEPAKLD